MTRHHPSNTTLGETIDRVTDRGVVIDSWAHLSAVNVDLRQVTVDSRTTMASIDTYAQYTENQP